MTPSTPPREQANAGKPRRSIPSLRLDSATMAPPPLRWDGERLHVLDQTALPFEQRQLVLASAGEVADAIRRLAVRGAPLIGVAAGYGMAMAAVAGQDIDAAAG